MIGILGRERPPDEAIARQALAAVPYPTPTVTLRRVGDCLLGIATRPDFVDEFLSSEGDIAAVMSGRIDNAADLHRELTAAGARPTSIADADVVVAAFRAHGPDVVNRFRGTFAGIVTDGRTLWAFRDHIGFRPMFFRNAPAELIVAGESRQVVVAAGIPEEPNLHVLEALMYSGLPSNTLAALKGVSRLPQGMVLAGGRESALDIHRYWNPWELLETSRISETDARVRFLELLEQASTRALTGHDAVLLSGGLDSPMVSAFAAPEYTRRTGRPLGALSAVFPDLPSVDESQWIELVAKRYGMQLNTYRPQARALDDVAMWSQRFATPVPTLSIPEVWEAYSRARSLGYQNVITGEFAELTFGKWPHMLGHLLLQGRFGALAAVISAQHARGSPLWSLVAQALAGLVPGRAATWYFRRKALPPASQRPDWIIASEEGRPDPRPDYSGSRARDRWRLLQMGGTSGNTVSMEADAVCGFIAGVTIRRPLSDIDLWEFFLSLRAEVKFPVLEWKALARRALPGVLPDEILNRRKTLFNEHVMQQVDYPILERYLTNPRHRLRPVNYERLNERIQRREIGFLDWILARELVRIHAFLDQW